MMDLKWTKLLRYGLAAVMSTLTVAALFIAIWDMEVEAVDKNNLMPTPPMGFNTWYTYTDNFNETTIKAVATSLANSGLRDLGYRYIQIDWGWCAGGREYDVRDANGNMVPDPNKFKSGIKTLADYLHNKGFKVGYYTDIGIEGCGKGIGSYGHYQQDIDSFISWGADFIKVDSCGGYVDYANHEAAYRAFAEYLAKATDSVSLGICCGGGYGVSDFGPDIGTYYRTSHDVSASIPKVLWEHEIYGVMKTFDNTSKHPENSMPGGYNDMDVLMLGPNNGLTDTENRTYFTIFCMQASTLFLAVDVTMLSKETMAIISNEEVIAVDQDPLCKAATKVREDTQKLQVWSKIQSNENGRAVRAVMLFNRSEKEGEITVRWSDLGLVGGCAVRDLWEKKDLGTLEEGYTAKVPSHGVVLLKVTGESDGRIEVEDYTDASGSDIKKEKCEEGTLDVCNIKDGNYLVFKNIDFGTGGLTFEARAASVAGGGKLEARLGSPTGRLVAECTVDATGGTQKWRSFTGELSDVAGRQTVYVIYTGNSMLSLDWVRFNHTGSTPEEKTTETTGLNDSESSSETESGTAARSEKGPNSLVYILGGAFIAAVIGAGAVVLLRREKAK